MERKRAESLLRTSGALLEGHFLLTSGNHSGRYIQCAALLSRPELAVEFMEDIAKEFAEAGIDTVVAPAIGGIIVSYEVARILGARALFLERENGRMTFRRGFGVEKGERVLVVEDVITTGGSVIEVRDTVRENGAETAGFASIVDRSGGRFDPDSPYYYSIHMDIPIYDPEQCPLCREGKPVVKPGSRGMGDTRKTG
ncbi:MAG: orotate phosphoribosyltransferase [Spirochaetes bacterium]|nr:orotate phosphoribosyltransferase [Spirochaetota bacterium]